MYCYRLVERNLPSTRPKNKNHPSSLVFFFKKPIALPRARISSGRYGPHAPGLGDGGRGRGRSGWSAVRVSAGQRRAERRAHVGRVDRGLVRVVVWRGRRWRRKHRRRIRRPADRWPAAGAERRRRWTSTGRGGARRLTGHWVGRPAGGPPVAEACGHWAGPACARYHP